MWTNQNIAEELKDLRQEICESLRSLATDLKTSQLSNSGLEQLTKAVQDLKTSPASASLDYGVRLVELEAKTAKLWSLLTEKNNRGEEKLSKFGKYIAKKI